MTGTLVEQARAGSAAWRKRISEWVSNFFRGTYNVRDYGAVGDGVTDDRVAIQNAYIAAYNAGRGEVYWPDGSYYMEPRDGFGFSSLKIFLWVFGSNITTRFASGATVKI